MLLGRGADVETLTNMTYLDVDDLGPDPLVALQAMFELDDQFAGTNAVVGQVTPLMLAVLFEDQRSASLLMERGGDPNRPIDTSTTTAAQMAASIGGPIAATVSG